MYRTILIFPSKREDVVCYVENEIPLAPDLYFILDLLDWPLPSLSVRELLVQLEFETLVADLMPLLQSHGGGSTGIGRNRD